jgi:hypothetical protein
MVGFPHFLNTIDFVLVSIGFGQRVLNDLKKARLSRGGMIWLLGPTLPTTVASVSLITTLKKDREG